jgi:CHRD domain-containing protein
VHINRRKGVAAAAALGITGALSAGAIAAADESGQNDPFTVTSRLSGYEEDPAAISTTGSGSLRLRVDPRAGTIAYTLRYADLEGDVLQAHVHFGGRAQSGGVSAFLCSNLGNGPVGTPECPTDNPGVVTGTIDADSVVGPAAQGIAPGEFEELLAAMRADTTYANVHSSLYPGGEIRSQIIVHH